LASASVLSPGIGSASSNLAVSSLWQKYRERNSSGRHAIRAPCCAAASTRSSACARFADGSSSTRIWISAIRSGAIPVA
jgi:hypothetical protein